MRQQLIVTATVDLSEGDFAPYLSDFIADLERNAKDTWADGAGGYEGPTIDDITTSVQVIDIVEPTAPAAYDPKVTLSRTTTRAIEETLVVHARELGLDWGLVTQAHALDEHLGAGDRARDAAFELVEDRVFFATKFKDRIVENVLNVQVDESVTIEIKE